MGEIIKGGGRCRKASMEPDLNEQFSLIIPTKKKQKVAVLVSDVFEEGNRRHGSLNVDKNWLQVAEGELGFKEYDVECKAAANEEMGVVLIFDGENCTIQKVAGKVEVKGEKEVVEEQIEWEGAEGFFDD